MMDFFHFNYLDIVIAIPLIWAIYRGWVKGFVLQLCSLAALLLGLWGAQELTGITVEYLKTNYDVTSPYTRVSVFAAIIIVIFILVYLIGFLLTKWIKVTVFSVPNRLMGVLFSLMKYWIIVGFAIFYIDKLNNSFNFMEPTLPTGSFFYGPMLKSTKWIYELFIF